MSDEDIEKLENTFPAASGSAFAAAREQGQSVFQSENGSIYEVHPDGSKKLIKQIEPPTVVIPGTKIHIR